MKKFNLLLFTIGLVSTLLAQQERGLSNRTLKRFNNEEAIADRKFEHFHFKGAAEHYKQALELKSSAKVQLKLADTYRLLNEPEESEFWYTQAIKRGAHLTDDDFLHYAQVLKTNGKYEEALTIFEKYVHKGEWVARKAEALKKTELFYTNEHAYEVEWAPFNSSSKDFSPTYQNNEVVFVSNRAGTGKKYLWDHSSFLELYKFEEGVVQEFHSNINTSFHEGPSTFFDNGSKLFFTRNNFHKNKMGLSKDGINKLNIYYSESKNGRNWSEPESFVHNSDEYSTAHPSITSDGTVLYFASDRPGGYGGVDIYKSEFRNGRWGAAENLGPEVNTPRDEMFPFIHKDSILYFSSTGHEGLGGLDIYRFRLNSKDSVENMGYPINTNADDFGISFYKNTNKAYFSSNRAGGMGDDDIYSVFVYDYTIDVKLVDAVTGEQIQSKGRIDVLKTLRTHLQDNGMTVPKTSHSFGVEAGTSFFVTGSADGYYQGNLIIQVSEEALHQVKRLSYEIPLTRLSGDQETEILVVVNNESPTQLFYTLDGVYQNYDGSLQGLKTYLAKENYEIVKETYLTNILYDFNQYSIRTDAAKSLDQVIDYLRSDKELSISLESHTDVRGSNQYNQLLAKRRVEAARDYLLQGGIERDRIFMGSYGEEQTLNKCELGCNEIEHQQNRRTEIRIEVNKRKVNNRLAALKH